MTSSTRFIRWGATVAALGCLTLNVMSEAPWARPAPKTCVLVRNPVAMHHTECPGQNLTEVTWARANLSYANLDGTNLTGAHLRLANLDHANLSYADLTNALMQESKLRFADLSHAKLISIATSLQGPYSTWSAPI